jgi:predicted dehydrogenase
VERRIGWTAGRMISAVSLRHLKSVKVIGAGSIGNHLAHAARRLGCDVLVCDVSDAALDRMRREVYPTRYGAWDNAIELCHADRAPVGGFDLICIGTPPDSHMALARQALAEQPKALQIEKPLCTPDLSGAAELHRAIREGSTRVFVGYDHVIGRAAQEMADRLAHGAIGEVTTFDVEFREHWGGIFSAHPWLDGPADSYLGFWRRGGGASGEHSHAMNFWQHISQLIGRGRVTEVMAMLRYVNGGAVDYDDCCFCVVRTEDGMVGRVVQDVVTRPVKKEAFIVGTRGTMRWINGYSPAGDAVVVAVAGQSPEVREIPKTRPDDFIWELQHIDAALEPGAPSSPMDIERGFDTMLVVAAAHESQRTGRTIRIDYSHGPTTRALA